MKFRHGNSLEGSVKVLKHDHQRETFFSPLDYVLIIQLVQSFNHYKKEVTGFEIVLHIFC